MIAVLTAMQEELTGIVDEPVLIEAKQHAYPESDKTPFPHILESDRDIVYILTGIGKVNAGAATQWAIDTFAPDTIINFGTAGALASDIRPGSIFLATHCVSADFDLTAFGHEKGFVPDTDRLMSCDKDFIAEANRIILSMGQSICGQDIVATTDSFISDAEKSKRIADEFNAKICDMEAAAIAQIAKRNSIPFCSIKKISDSADDEATETFESLEQEKTDIAEEARIVVEKLLDTLSQKMKKGKDSQ